MVKLALKRSFVTRPDANIRHENGLETLYAHLSKRIVSEGDKLAAGETLGLGGNTGRSSGSLYILKQDT